MQMKECNSIILNVAAAHETLSRKHHKRLVQYLIDKAHKASLIIKRCPDSTLNLQLTTLTNRPVSKDA